MSDTKQDQVTATVPVPKWWHRVHSYVFIALILFHILWPGFLLALIVNSRLPIGEWVMFLLMGAGVGQLFLLGIWTALGGLRMVVRIGLAPLITLLVVSHLILELSFSKVGLPPVRNLWLLVFGCMIFGSTPVWMLHSALLPLRWLLGWRVDFDPAYHRTASHGAMQVGIKHFIGWTIISAIPFALARTITLAADNEDKTEVQLALVLYSLVGVAIALVVGGPLALACLAKTRAWLKIPAAIVWAAVLTLCAAQVFLQFQQQGFGPPEHIVYLTCAITVSAFAGTILGNLLFLRLFGLQLFNVKPKQPNSSAPAEHP